MFRSLSHSCLVLDGLIPFVFVFLQCRELEVDLDNETRRGSEIQKNAKKMERRLKDVSQQQEEDQRNLQHAKDQIDRLNKKCKTTKTLVMECATLATTPATVLQTSSEWTPCTIHIVTFPDHKLV